MTFFFNAFMKSQTRAAPHLPVLVLWLEGHQGTLFAAGEDVLWGGAVNLLQLGALFLTLSTICNHIRNIFLVLFFLFSTFLYILSTDG